MWARTITALSLFPRKRVAAVLKRSEKLWDNSGNFVDEHALTVNINRLRAKIESDEHKYIKTVYGMGYQWDGERL